MDIKNANPGTGQYNIDPPPIGDKNKGRTMFFKYP